MFLYMHPVMRKEEGREAVKLEIHIGLSAGTTSRGRPKKWNMEGGEEGGGWYKYG